MTIDAGQGTGTTTNNSGIIDFTPAWVHGHARRALAFAQAGREAFGDSGASAAWWYALGELEDRWRGIEDDPDDPSEMDVRDLYMRLVTMIASGEKPSE